MVYVSKDNEGSALTFNEQTPEDIPIYKVVSLNIVKAYDLFFDSEAEKSTFRIEISENLRNGLKVKIDLIQRADPSNNYNLPGICENNNKILSCITSENHIISSTDLILINFKKVSGTITWVGKTGVMKIPLLEHELKFVSTAEPNFSNNKWNFTINAYNKKFIPLYSQLIIDIRQNNAESIAICENDHTNTNDLTKFL